MAFTIGVLPLPGYPMQFGDKTVVKLDRTGPTSYTQFTPSTGAGGDVFNAQTAGLNWGGFDIIDPVVDTTGQIMCYPVCYQGGNGNAVAQYTLRYFSLTTATLGGVSQTAGTEIGATTNLSTFSWRLRCVVV